CNRGIPRTQSTTNSEQLSRKPEDCRQPRNPVTVFTHNIQTPLRHSLSQQTTILIKPRFTLPSR
ncbi:hypothetical protein BaRGS_00030529, partial [Batillaria attramentaria]